jgi:hypothetical protein
VFLGLMKCYGLSSQLAMVWISGATNSGIE